jgi:hypothetical protein
MYRHCIYCSADLGTNDAIEEFPVGRAVAVDAAKGRLWAVCPRCARWNLAPIEERWEAVEAAEKLFAGARLRVQGENVGLAKLRDGTKLVRIGRAEGREVAAWRYGEVMATRQRRAKWVRRGANAVTLLDVAGLGAWWLGAALPLTPMALWLPAWSLTHTVLRVIEMRRGERRIHQLPAEAAPAVGAMTLRAGDLHGARLVLGGDQRLRMDLPRVMDTRGFRAKPRSMRIEGPEVLPLLARAMVLRNAAGAPPAGVDAALDVLARTPTPEAIVAELLAEFGRYGRRLPVGRAPGDDLAVEMGIRVERAHEPFGADREKRPYVAPLPDVKALAMEMALHEEQERRALEGELVLLESAWRQAEEIAAIADRLALPDDPERRG